MNKFAMHHWTVLAAALLLQSACATLLPNIQPNILPTRGTSAANPPAAAAPAASSPSIAPDSTVQATPAPPLPAQVKLIPRTLVPVAPPQVARFFTSPSELRDELALHEVLPRFYAGVEVEGQSGYDKQGPDSNTDSYFDSATVALRWVPFFGLNVSAEGSYDLHNSDGFALDEAVVTLGAVPNEPWYVTVGHTNLPFGEFNSHFREDPATQVLGEIQGSEVAGGYETDALEVTLAVRKGRSGDKQFSWVANITFSPVQDLDVGVFWASDLTRSAEIKTLAQDQHDQNPGTIVARKAVRGAGTFMSFQKNQYSIDFEYIASVDQFEPGLIDDDGGRAWAWNFEATYRLSNPWEIGARVEGSSGLPGSPELQFGVETSYGFGPHMALSFEYLRGKFADDPDRDLVTLGLVLRW